MAGLQMPKRGSGAAMLRDLREDERSPLAEEPNTPPTASRVSYEDSSAVAQNTSNADSIKVADATDSVDSSRMLAEVKGANPSRKVRKQSDKGNTLVAQTTRSAVGSTMKKTKPRSGGDPVRNAMLEMLAQPYPDDMSEGVMTVTSVKIPKLIWERLEYARVITKWDKQDIIAEALRQYFDRIAEVFGE